MPRATPRRFTGPAAIALQWLLPAAFAAWVWRHWQDWHLAVHALMITGAISLMVRHMLVGMAGAGSGGSSSGDIGLVGGGYTFSDSDFGSGEDSGSCGTDSGGSDGGGDSGGSCD